MKTLEVGEKVIICGLKYVVYDSLYCEHDGERNSECFDIINVDKEEFTTNILGYYSCGGFPYCNSLEDLTKLVNALNEEYDRQQGISKGFVLPEKWCVLVHSFDMIKTHAKSKGYSIEDSWLTRSSDFYYYSDENTGYIFPEFVSKELNKDYTKITFEQFKQYVLKESVEETNKYDFSTTITRAVKNNDPNIIAIETGKSIEELCKLVEDIDNSCLRHKLDSNHLYNCDGLTCSECPLSELTRNLSKSKIISWLKSNSLEVKNPEFKVGDWVTITKSNRNWVSEMDTLDGKTVQITEVNSSIRNETDIRFENSKWYTWRYEQGHFRHATKEEIESVTKTNKPFDYNKWYKSKTNNLLAFIISDKEGYGFSVNNEWENWIEVLDWDKNNLVPASDKEVTERLLEYAKKKYPIGTKLKECLQGWIKDNEIGIIKSKPYWDIYEIWVMGSVYGLCIYLNGKWAEIESKTIQKEWLSVNDTSIGKIKYMNKGKIDGIASEYHAISEECVKQQEFDPYSPIIELE